jgi:hypothetical protein
LALDPLPGEVGGGVVGPGRAKPAASVGSSSVVVPGILAEDRPQVAFTEDQHPVGDLGPGGKYEPFRIGIRARTSGRDFHGFDSGGGQDRVEGVGELPGAVADQEPEICDAVAEVHQEVADLLGGPRPVWMGCDPEDVYVSGADFDDEEAVQALEYYSAVHVKEVGGKHGRGLRMQELPPGRGGLPFWCRWDLQSLEDAAIVDALTR